MAGQDRQAIPVLMTLADQEASDGFAAKALDRQTGQVCNAATRIEP